MKKPSKFKLVLRAEQIAVLDRQDMALVQGGGTFTRLNNSVCFQCQDPR